MEPSMTILLCLLAVGYSFQLASVPLETQDEVWESMMHNDHDGHINTKRPKVFVDPSSCSIESCGGRRNVTLWKQIGRWFQDIFYTREEIANLNLCLISPTKCNKSTNQSVSVRPPSSQQLNRETLTGSLDYDQCCMTSRSVQTVSGMMTDIYNKQYTVVSYNNQDNQFKYQISYVGICTPNNPSGCSGTCRQETGIDSFLCFDEFMKMGFRLFYSNSYCSCKAN